MQQAWHILESAEEESFWPSFTDIMMVISMVFLLISLTVVLLNNRLVENLKQSLLEETSAKALALSSAEEARLAKLSAERSAAIAEEEFRAKTSLSEQLEQIQTNARVSELELLATKEELAKVNKFNLEQTTVIHDLQTIVDQQNAKLSEKERSLIELQAQVDLAELSLSKAQQSLKSNQDELTQLRTLVQEGQSQLFSMRGEYTKLENKYQKLLRPARSSMGKKIAEVIYRKDQILFRLLTENTERQVVTKEQLNDKLQQVKQKWGNELYVRIIIPQDSGLSYQDAWAFTQDLLNKYDYYYQTN